MKVYESIFYIYKINISLKIDIILVSFISLPVSTRLKSSSRQPLATVVLSKASTLLRASALSPELLQQTCIEQGVNGNDNTFGGPLSSLTMGNKKLLAVRTCRMNYLSCLALMHKKKKIKFNRQKTFVNDIKLNKVICKLQN